MTRRPPPITPPPDLDFLVESIPNPLHGNETARKKLWPSLLIPLLLSLIAALICFQTTGPTLGLFLGGIFAVTLLIGPLAAAEQTWTGWLLAIIGVVHGIAGVWIYVALQYHLRIWATFDCYLVLGAFCLSLASMARLLRRLHLGISGAAAITTLIALAWLLWPIWLSPVLAGPHGQRIVSILTPIHPIMAMNAAVRDQLGYWAEQAIAYHYTILNEDLNYSLPTSVLGCVTFHLLLAGLFLGISALSSRTRKQGG